MQTWGSTKLHTFLQEQFYKQTEAEIPPEIKATLDYT